VNQRELDDSFSDAAPGFAVCTFSMVRYHTVVRTAGDRHFWYKFRKAQKRPLAACLSLRLTFQAQ